MLGKKAKMTIMISVIVILLTSCSREFTSDDLLESTDITKEDATVANDSINQDTNTFLYYVDSDRFHDIDETVVVDKEFSYHIDNVLLTSELSEGGEFFTNSQFIQQNKEFMIQRYGLAEDTLRYLFVTVTIKNVSSSEITYYFNSINLYNYRKENNSVEQLSTVIDFDKSDYQYGSKSYFEHTFQSEESIQTTLAYIIEQDTVYSPYVYLGGGYCLAESNNYKSHKNKSLVIQFINLGLDYHEECTE